MAGLDLMVRRLTLTDCEKVKLPSPALFVWSPVFSFQNRMNTSETAVRATASWKGPISPLASAATFEETERTNQRTNI